MKNHRLLFTLAASALAILGFGASHASAQVTLLDGGFELPAIAANSFVAGGGASWTPSGGNDFVISNNYADPSVGPLGNTPYGTQYLDLDATGSVDSQVVSGFLAGQVYVLGANFADLFGGANPVFTLSVSGAATASGTFTGLVGGPYGTGTIPFQSAVIVFTALTSGSATITLTNNSGLSGNNFSPALAVDNVSLYGGLVTPPLVPEPTTTAALLLGVGALGVGMIRRRCRHA